MFAFSNDNADVDDGNDDDKTPTTSRRRASRRCSLPKTFVFSCDKDDEDIYDETNAHAPHAAVIVRGGEAATHQQSITYNVDNTVRRVLRERYVTFDNEEPAVTSTLYHGRRRSTSSSITHQITKLFRKTTTSTSTTSDDKSENNNLLLPDYDDCIASISRQQDHAFCGENPVITNNNH